MTDALKATTIADIQKISHEEIVELPRFATGDTFIAKLRRPSIVRMCQLGQIPNPLAAAVDELLEPKQDEKAYNTTLSQRFEVLQIMAKAALEEPHYTDELAEVLTYNQLLAIWAWVVNGPGALIPFRAVPEFFAALSDRQQVADEAEPADGTDG